MSRLHTLLVVASLVLACRTYVIAHDQNRAVTDANRALKALYFDLDSEAAYQHFEPAFQKAYPASKLDFIVKDLQKMAGPLKQLTAESYQPMPGQRAITLYYDGVNENGRTYHRVVVTGDRNGYP